MCPWRVKIKQPLQKSRKLSLIYRTLPNQTVTEVRSKFWSWSFVKILKLNFSQEVDAEQNNKVTIEICSSSNPKNSARWRVPELPLIILCWVVFAVAMLLLHLLSLTVKRPFLNTPLSIQGSDCNECLQIHICKLVGEKKYYVCFCICPLNILSIHLGLVYLWSFSQGQSRQVLNHWWLTSEIRNRIFEVLLAPEEHEWWYYESNPGQWWCFRVL